MSRYRVGISGSYGGMNVGDEAILEGILQQLRGASDVEVVVFSKNPEHTQKHHHVKAVPVREMQKEQVLEELKQLDLFVLGGGGLLFDGLVENFLRDVQWAKELGIPVMTYAISAGPLKAPESKQLVAQVLNRVDVVTVREGQAKRTLHDLGLEKEVEVTADPALLIKPQPFDEAMLKAEGIDPALPLIGFSAREPGPAAPDLNVDQYHALLADAADFMVERFGAQILFVPMEKGGRRDLQHSHAIISKMANAKRAQVLKGDYSPGQVLGLVGSMDFTVGMRLHFLIFAALQRVPFVPLPYAGKVSGFLADLKMPVTALEEVNVGKLCAVIDRTWDLRVEVRRKLDQEMPPLQERARRTHRILCELLAKQRPASDGSGV